MLKNTHKLAYIFLASCFILTCLSLLCAHNNPATSYEYSIYALTPTFVWFTIILSFIVGITIVISLIYTNQKNNLLIKYSLILIFINYIFCLSLLIIRGYYMWNMSGDPATHIGHIKLILSNGYIDDNLVYPIIHIFSAEFSLLTNIDSPIFHKIIPLLFGILYVFFMYILLSFIFDNKCTVIIALLLTFPFIEGSFTRLTPNGLANLYIPLAIFLLLKRIHRNEFSWGIMILIILFLYPLFHPLPAFTFLLILLTSIATLKFLHEYQKLYENKILANRKYGLYLFLFMAVWLITWISSFYIWESLITNFNFLLTEETTSHVEQVSFLMKYAQNYGYSVNQHILKLYGGIIIYGLLSILAAYTIIQNINKKENIDYYVLYGALVIISLLTMFLLVANFRFSPLRLVFYLGIFTTIFAGYFIAHIVQKIHRKQHIMRLPLLIIITVGICLIYINSIFILYPSAYTLNNNYHTPEDEIKGMDWILKHKNSDIKITGIAIATNRFADILLTPEEKKNQNIKFYFPRELRPPYHFKHNNSGLSNYYKEDIYLRTRLEDKLIYEKVFPKMAEIRWTPEDFQKLSDDKNIYKIYTNHYFETSYINSLNTKESNV